MGSKKPEAKLERLKAKREFQIAGTADRLLAKTEDGRFDGRSHTKAKQKAERRKKAEG